jgi:NTE family protein
MPKKNKNLRIGLALGGGGARGLAHVGVLKVLERAGIVPDVIVGTSMGSIIGALYCHFQDAQLTANKVIHQLKSPKMADLGLAKFQQEKSQELIKRNMQKTLEHLSRIYLLTSVLTKDHIIAEEKVKTLLSLLLPKGNIEDLPLPFGAVAADLLQGKPHLFLKGPIQQATQASAAIPGVFPPVEYQNMQLVDGAIVALVPVQETLAMGADFIIAVDVSPFNITSKLYKTGIEIWLRADQITGKTLRDQYLKDAHAVITIDNMTYEWYAFDAAEEIIAAGEQAAEQALPAIQKALHTRLPWWKRWFSFKK